MSRTVLTSPGYPSRKARGECAWFGAELPGELVTISGRQVTSGCTPCCSGARTARLHQAVFCGGGAGLRFARASDNCVCPLEHHLGIEIPTPVLQFPSFCLFSTLQLNILST